MAKLQRKSAKLFAEEATATAGGIAQFGSLAAGTPNYSTDPDVIQALDAYKEGWSSAVLGTKSPALEDRNALDYLLSYQQAYIMQRGIPEWIDTETYYQGSFVSKADGKLYASKVDNNTGNDPATDTTETYWLRFPTPAELNNYVLKAGDTMTGDLNIQYNGPKISLTNTGISSSTNGYNLQVNGTGDLLILSKSYKGLMLDTNTDSFPAYYDGLNRRRLLYTVQSNISGAETGYIKLGPTSLKIQWGITGNISPDSSVTVTLPTPFDSTNYQVTAVWAYNASPSGNKRDGYSVNSLTTTSFVMSSQNETQNTAYRWIAIGR